MTSTHDIPRPETLEKSLSHTRDDIEERAVLVVGNGCGVNLARRVVNAATEHADRVVFFEDRGRHADGDVLPSSSAGNTRAQVVFGSTSEPQSLDAAVLMSRASLIVVLADAIETPDNVAAMLRTLAVAATKHGAWLLLMLGETGQLATLARHTLGEGIPDWIAFHIDDDTILQLDATTFLTQRLEAHMPRGKGQALDLNALFELLLHLSKT
ncbi:MAG: hypothetical protein AAGK78_01390 [Planctomycetota bacterium]